MATRWSEPGPWSPWAKPGQPPLLGMDIGEIIASRSHMVRSETKIGVLEAQAPGKLLEACQQIAMSSAPVGTEVSFFKPPQGRLQFDGVLSPSGPSGELKKMEITTNPLIPRKVDEIVEDRDAVASVALGELYSAGIRPGSHLSHAFSGPAGQEEKAGADALVDHRFGRHDRQRAQGSRFGQAAG